MRSPFLTPKALKVMNDSIISGTIPRDTETRPHVQVSYDDSALRGQANPNTKTIGMLGAAENGKPNHVYTIKSLVQAQNIFGGGPLLDAIEMAWQPAFQAYGESGVVYAERVQNASQATLDAGALHFVSTTYGDHANDVQVSLDKNQLDGTWTVRVTNQVDGYHHTYSELGLLANIQYVPNDTRVDKNGKPEARATMEIKPKEDPSLGHISETGQSAELVLHFHDTLHPTTLHNNLTNNVYNSGSTVYEPDGSEHQLKNDAQKGDPNPDAGPIRDWDESFNLTDTNKYHNVFNLLNAINQLPGMNVEAVDNHNISNIQTTMLDLTSKPVNILPSVNDDTTDAEGNIINPAGIWSTLGDIVDKLRWDSEVDCYADMSHQLNIIPADRIFMRSHNDTTPEAPVNKSNDMINVRIYLNNLINQLSMAHHDNNMPIYNDDIRQLSHAGEILSHSNYSVVGNAIKNGVHNLHNINTKDFRSQLQSLKKQANAIAISDNDKSAPSGFFGSVLTSGGDCINVLGEPIQAFAYTSLTGGVTKPVPVSWESKFHAFDNKPVYDFVVLTSNPSVHAELGGYIQDRYQSNHNIRGFVGAGFREPIQQLVQRSSDLDDERLYLCGTSGIYPMEDGRKLHVPGYMVAACLAGIDSALPVGDSITNKKVGLSSVDVNYSTTALDSADENGVIMVSPVINRGVASEFTISDDVSTNNDLSDPVKAELQLGEITDFLFDDLRMYLQQYIGSPVNISSASVLANAVNDFLDKNKANPSGMIIDYNPDDIYCEIHGESAFISFSVAPVRTLKYINVVGSYDDFDMTSEGGNTNTESSFEYINANGQVSTDDSTNDTTQFNDMSNSDNVNGENEESPD